MITDLYLRGRLRHDLSTEEREALDGAVERLIDVRPRATVVRRGQPLDRSFYLVSGNVFRVIDDKRGVRQIVGINVPGDFVDLHGYAMKRLDHSICALDQVVLAEVPHAAITGLVDRYPHLARAMWFSTLLDAAMHREWIFRLGRLAAEGRIAHLMAELCERTRMVGLFDGVRLPVPLLQRDYAEACGISLVHANRSIRNLKDRGFIRALGDGLIDVVDERGLAALGEFTPAYLYGDGELHVDALTDHA